MGQFYKYIIYRLYGWFKKMRYDRSPDASVIVVLALVHWAQIFSVPIIIKKLWPSILLPRILPPYFFGFLLLFSVAHYFLFYNKEKWASYEKEFEDESRADRLKGKFFVLTYLIVSAFSPILLVVLFT
ncbi:hypothetical protein CLV59_108339 [Chitinophaga dinghuensis]|uniref:Uncharacterized protein n=1 Tax=Chitinophaga dinghuensis TaxID=1539050 RepID=A0A327VS97_9BACT|nr:hypothetical protein [Chitinophaga dinghuensis]RAJ76818.1 hypothetical protein CLV59_108339 [Chitinophaga dinghuensis]